MPIPKDFLDLLACSFCKSELDQVEDKLVCRNPRCNLKFFVRENIPNMLLDAAERSCPGCSATREVKGDALCCPKCGETLKVVPR